MVSAGRGQPRRRNRRARRRRAAAQDRPGRVHPQPVRRKVRGRSLSVDRRLARTGRRVRPAHPRCRSGPSHRKLRQGLPGRRRWRIRARQLPAHQPGRQPRARRPGRRKIMGALYRQTRRARHRHRHSPGPQGCALRAVPLRYGQRTVQRRPEPRRGHPDLGFRHPRPPDARLGGLAACDVQGHDGLY